MYRGRRAWRWRSTGSRLFQEQGNSIRGRRGSYGSFRRLCVAALDSAPDDTVGGQEAREKDARLDRSLEHARDRHRHLG